MPSAAQYVKLTPIQSTDRPRRPLHHATLTPQARIIQMNVARSSGRKSGGSMRHQLGSSE
eukprot:13519023-Alexandrium_andersonii.AAC.1